MSEELWIRCELLSRAGYVEVEVWTVDPAGNPSPTTARVVYADERQLGEVVRDVASEWRVSGAMLLSDCFESAADRVALQNRARSARRLRT